MTQSYGDCTGVDTASYARTHGKQHCTFGMTFLAFSQENVSLCLLNKFLISAGKF